MRFLWWLVIFPAAFFGGLIGSWFGMMASVLFAFLNGTGPSGFLGVFTHVVQVGAWIGLGVGAGGGVLAALVKTSE